MSGMPLPRNAAVGAWRVHWKSSVLAVGRRRVRTGLPQLAAHERVLVRESTVDGTEYLGTNHALYQRTAALAARDWRRVGWIDVAAVDWSRPAGRLTLRLWPEAADRAVPLQVSAGSRLPRFAAERVTAFQIVSRRVRIGDGCSATMTAVRDPAGGEVSWRVRLDGADDPALAPAIDATLATLRGQLGC
jgi:hypothetical protein